MLLNELDKRTDWSKAQVGLLFKQAKANLDPRQGKIRPPLDDQFGQRRAVRDGDGKVIGPGGAMHPNISPEKAKQELTRYAQEVQTGRAKPFGQLPKHSHTWDALRNRTRRSTPNRPAVWPDGSTADPATGKPTKKRVFTTPDGERRITRGKPYHPDQQAQTQQIAQTPTPQPELASAEQAAQAKAAEQSRRQISKQHQGVLRGRLGRTRYTGKGGSKHSNEFTKKLDEALGNGRS